MCRDCSPLIARFPVSVCVQRLREMKTGVAPPWKGNPLQAERSSSSASAFWRTWLKPFNPASEACCFAMASCKSLARHESNSPRNPGVFGSYYTTLMRMALILSSHPHRPLALSSAPYLCVPPRYCL